MKYEQDLGRNPANYAPLTPLSFIERAAYVYPQRLAVVYEDERYTWKETYARSRRLASALSKRGIGPGDTVAVLLPNTPPMYEAHFGVPMCGAVLNTLNTRLDASAIEFMLKHGEAKLLVVDREFKNLIGRPGIPVIDDSEYESFLKEGDPEYEWRWPKDEWEAISLNYTSGTTGDPKGVVYHHRGAYLNALCNIVTWAMPHHAVYLWTLPMFHCNGWTFPWTMAANAGTNVCLRKVDAQKIFDLIRKEKVTHYCGAPIVHSTLINAPEEMKKGITHKVNAMVAAAAPPAAMIEGMERMGWNITHVYGLTEVYGPATVCAKHPEWEELPLAEQVRLNGRQGVRYHVEEGLSVMDP
ncbi:MAG TPA: AMP-binding protein, partial [Burkholderiales bacterium]|nr:AMP-binding protein [Burkholderiales bacterium]